MMDLLKPPTDNLYKFMTVGGIVLTVVGVIFPPMFFQQTAMEYLAHLHGRDELKVHEKFTKERLETLELRKQQTADEKNKLQQRLNQLTSGSRVSGNSGEIDKLESRIKETDRQLESIADASYQANLDLGLKEAQTKYEETVSINRRRDSRYFMVIGWVVALIGLYFSIIGFRRWHKRLQQFQDRMVENEAGGALKAKTEATNEVEQGKPVIKPTQVEIGKPTQ